MTRGELLGYAALVSAPPAWGQTAPPPSPERVAQAAPKTGDTGVSGEIVVTATRRAERTLDIPYNVSAIGGARIDANQTRDQAELLRQIPGVAVVDRGRRNAGTLNTVTIRGINVDSSALGDYSVSSVAPVSTYVNDTPLFAQFLLKDLDRVEVLRGPQGTLYGSGSLGGTIRYILNKPVLGEWQGRATAGASYANGSASVGYEGDLILNIPIGKTIAIRAVGSRQDYPGITDYPNVYNTGADGLPVAPGGNVFAPIDKTNPSATFHRVKDADYVRVWYGRVAALWQPSDTVDLTLTYNHQSDHVGGRRQATRGVDGFGRPYGQYENGSVQLEPSSRLVNSVALEANVDFGFATLTSSTSYYDHEGSSISENTGFYAKAGFLNFYYNYPRPIDSAVRTYKDRSFIEEVRLVSKAGHSFDYVIGGYYDSQKLLSTQDSFLRGYKRYADAAFGPGIVGTDQDFLYRRHEAFEDRAAFGELTWHITDKVQVTGGGRYINNSSNNDTRIAIPVYVATSAATVANFRNGDDRGLFKANASWKFARDNLGYVTVSQGFRRGGSNAVPTIGRYAESATFERYGSDSVINYEVGAKGRLMGLTYNLDAFYIDWSNIQLNTATPNFGFYVVANGPGARSQGIEASLDGRTGPLHYGIGYTYTDARLTHSFFSPDPTHILYGRRFDRLPGSAKHIATVSADYTLPLDAKTSLVLRGDGFYQSDTQNAVSQSPLFAAKLPGFSIWNGSVAVTRGKYSATLYGKNLFNVAGTTGRYTEAYMGTAPELGYYGNANKDLITLPRTVGITLDARF